MSPVEGQEVPSLVLVHVQFANMIYAVGGAFALVFLEIYFVLLGVAPVEGKLVCGRAYESGNKWVLENNATTKKEDDLPKTWRSHRRPRPTAGVIAQSSVVLANVHRVKGNVPTYLSTRVLRIFGVRRRIQISGPNSDHGRVDTINNIRFQIGKRRNRFIIPCGWIRSNFV